MTTLEMLRGLRDEATASGLDAEQTAEEWAKCSGKALPAEYWKGRAAGRFDVGRCIDAEIKRLEGMKEKP